MTRRILLALFAALALTAAPAQAKTATLRAGAGQADITPQQTGYYLGGWTRADRLATGQSTRLYANTMVLQRGNTKVALVAAELFGVSAGMQEDIAKQVADLGFDKTNILLAASHTHSGPGGFFNNKTYNTAAPKVDPTIDPVGFIKLLAPDPADVQLYTFLVKQIASSIRRANANLAPAKAAWGHATLDGLTQNRSLAAHLRDHGITVADDAAKVSMDPDGYTHTIDDNVDVLRVDQLVKTKVKGSKKTKTTAIPIGAYSNFADHGTVVHSETQAYSGDHHAAAWRLFADQVRKYAHVPKSKPIVNVYPNADEGDQTAGIVHVGPAAAVFVGGKEASAMFDAWKAAGKHLSSTSALDYRWTRACFCGQMTSTGKVDTKGVEGLGFLTGSDEGRGPLYDVTQVSFEGKTNPIEDPVQGDKIQAPVGDPPPAVPISVIRIGDGVLASVPGEPTKEVGVRIRAKVLAALGPAGVTHAVIAGLANDYIQYVTTPEEYGEQSYEGASTLYGKNEGTWFVERLGDLATALASGQPAAKPDDLDPFYGVHATGPDYPAGAASGTITTQPGNVARLGQVTMAWTGGPSGHDRPLDKAFIRAERQVGKRWRVVDSDLALAMLWRVDDQGHYTLQWEPAATVPTGTYRLHVTATRYELISNSFQVSPATNLRRSGNTLVYPAARPDIDLIPAPNPVTVGLGRATDRYGNRAR